MARVSFTLRRPSDTQLGSTLRYSNVEVYETSGAGGTAASAGARPDQDTALRADGLQTAPTNGFPNSFFEAVSVCYGEVSLNWQVNIEAEGASPSVTGIVLVYSSLGEPQTIGSGDVLVESSNTFSYEHTGLTEGRWAYYSLFVHYTSSGGDDYYERAASLAVIVPKNYASNIMLWERIPEYYRNQDTSIGDTDHSPCIGNVPPGNVVGPLFKFLSVVGFEIDRIRTLIDYQMVSYDPNLANTEHLDALAEQLAVPMVLSDLGGKRLRTLINDIGFFRRSKGTLTGTRLFGRAVSGSDMDIDTATGEITVYSQRVNYITNPKTGSGITTHRAALNSEELTPLPFSSTAASAGSSSYTESGSVFQTTGTGASIGIQHVLIHLSSPVPALDQDRVVFSVQSNVGTTAIKWARLVNGSGTTLGFQDTPSSVSGSTAFEIIADTGAAEGVFTNTYIEYLVDLSEVPTFENKLLLAERNYLGTYFDGDTVRGGWLIDSSSVSDYRWAGAANSSVSIFAEDYERTKGIVTELLYEVLPVTEVSKYTIVSYNAVPGF